jgi:hypothetical protein
LLGRLFPAILPGAQTWGGNTRPYSPLHMVAFIFQTP